jgi:energy-coupling factor transporter ATP-binding protein EcfA2
MPITMTNKSTDNLNAVNQQYLYLHASSVSVSGKALLFLGHSTSGKSTINRLLSERYPIVADDKVRVYKKNGSWLVGDGSDNFTSKGVNSPSTENQIKYPLLAVLRIYKAGATEITPLSPRETCRHLVDAVFEVDKQRKPKDLGTIKRWFIKVAEISKKIEGWHLTFKKDASILDLIYEIFESRLSQEGDMIRKANSHIIGVK